MNQNLTEKSSLNDWLKYLEQNHPITIDLGLERIQAVAQQLDLLQPAPFVITVAGTNGKGTTCRLLETILLNSGLKVGVYSSPHLLRYNERVRIQGEELPDEVHSQSFAFIEKERNQSLSYFEFSTLSAFDLFKKANLDIVILEVGLGGRLDATNIIDPNIAVITSIDIDHTGFLGNTREQIALEKAGIFRANRPAIIGDPNVPQTMLEYAKNLNCQLFCRDIDWQMEQLDEHWNWQGEVAKQKVRYQNLPFCQIPLQNAATVLAVLQFLPFSISKDIIHKSLKEVSLVGRFQRINQLQQKKLAEIVQKPIKKLPNIIIDVGHNPHAARYLKEQLKRQKIAGKIIAVCGMLLDKDATGVFEPIVEMIEQWICVTLTGERGQTAEELAEKLKLSTLINTLKIDIETDVENGVKKALAMATPDDLILVFGSFHTVGAFLEMLN